MAAGEPIGSVRVAIGTDDTLSLEFG